MLRLPLLPQFVGYNDDVLDMQLAGTDGAHLVVATNSPLVKVFTVSSWSCQVLRGHTDIVLCVSVNKAGHLFATGSKVMCSHIMYSKTSDHGKSLVFLSWKVKECHGISI